MKSYKVNVIKKKLKNGFLILQAVRKQTGNCSEPGRRNLNSYAERKWKSLLHKWQRLL